MRSNTTARIPYPENAIAIVGLACRTPGANSPAELWELVRKSRSAIRPLTQSEKELLSTARTRRPGFVGVTGALDDVGGFDAAFFNIGPRDAALMDPQHRHFLECCWEAFESAAILPGCDAGAVGVFAGCGPNGYLQHNLRSNPDLFDELGEFLVRHTSNDKDFLATGVSYRLDLRGPSVNVQTACSTSLVAVHLAVQSLLARECDMALAGGSTIEVPVAQGYIYREGEVLARDGVCRPFDSQASGTVLTSGTGVVLLRRLADAEAAGDPIHAVILGSAVNNDGSGKVGYLAPSVDGHAAVVEEALDVAGVSARSIGLLEAHGTGTLLGDPIEVRALTKAFSAHTGDVGFCRLGSTKANVGHLDTAAGVVSLIKTVMALKHGELPPLANFKHANPLLEIDSSPFYLGTLPAVWEADEEAPRRAGVSSLGVGGTNAHVVLQEYRQTASEHLEDSGCEALILSAGSEEALKQNATEIGKWLESNREVNLADVAYTLQTTRRPGPFASVIVATSTNDGIRWLREALPVQRVQQLADPSPVFLFPGGGSQFPAMGADLYEQDSVFRAYVEECLEALAPEHAARIRLLAFMSDQPDHADAAIERTVMQLPALFAFEYALARRLMDVGIQPAAMTGHSLGEYVAATVAGVFSAADAMRIVTRRGEIVDGVTDCATLAVSVGESELEQLVEGTGLDIAVVNHPGLCVVSGTNFDISKFEAQIKDRGIEFRRLRIAGAAHSRLLQPHLESFRTFLGGVEMRRPTLPFMSNTAGEWADPIAVTTPEYWARHLRNTVRFGDGLEAIARSHPSALLIEIGPGQALCSLSKALLGPKRTIAVPLQPRFGAGTDGYEYFLTAVGLLSLMGAPVQWARLHHDPRRVSLPSHSWNHQLHWISPGKDTGLREQPVSTGAWIPAWQRQESSFARQKSACEVLIFSNSRRGQRLESAFESSGHAVETVTELGRLRQRIQECSQERAWPDVLIVDARDQQRSGRKVRSLASLELLQNLATQLTGAALPESLRFVIVTSGACAVVPNDRACPDQAALHGAALVVDSELPGVRCFAIDLPKMAEKRDLAAAVACITRDTVPAGVTAIRMGRNWLEKLEPVDMPLSREISTEDSGVDVVVGGSGTIGRKLIARLVDSGAKVAAVSRGATRAAFPTAATAWECDITDAGAVRELAARLKARFGRIHRVFHLAAALGDAPIGAKPFEEMKMVLRPKTEGTLNLLNAFDDPATRFVLFSSVSAWAGIPGQFDYAAANAFVDAVPGISGARNVQVIDWGPWRPSDGQGPSRPRRSFVHPLLQTPETDDAGYWIFELDLDGSEWFVDEHRTASGIRVVPGTAHLELARGAVSHILGTGALELTDVAFLAPLSVSEGRAVHAQLRVSPISPDGAVAFDIGSCGPDGPIVYATGSARRLTNSPSAATATLNWRQDHSLPQPDHLRLGDHWHCLRARATTDSCDVGYISLPPQYREELPTFSLHPAMVDVATGFALDRLDGTSKASAYLPMGYKAVRIYQSLPPQVVATAMFRNEPGSDVIESDVRLYSSTGEELAEFVGLTLLRAVSTASLETGRLSNGGPSVLPRALARLALDPDEALDALFAVVDYPEVPRVMIAAAPPAAFHAYAKGAAETSNAVSRPAGLGAIAAPENSVQERLAIIWREQLGVSDIGIDDDFFELGGHSLIALRVLSRVKEQFGVDPGLKAFFDCRTIRDFAGLVGTPSGEARQPEHSSILVPIKSGATTVDPIFCIHGMNGNVMNFYDIAAGVGNQREFYGLQSPHVMAEGLPVQPLEEVASEYLEAIRSVQATGRLTICGFSGGGLIAFEIARQVSAAGDPSPRIVMLDTYCPPFLFKSRYQKVRWFAEGVLRGGPGFVRRFWQRRRFNPVYMGEADVASQRAADAFLSAQDGYSLPRLPLDVTILRASERGDANYVPPHLGWKPFVRGRITSIDVPGGHEGMCRGENGRFVGAIIDSIADDKFEVPTRPD